MSIDSPIYLTLDQGGSASRAVLVDAHGNTHAVHRLAVAHQRPHPGWVEQDPDAVVDSLRIVAEQAVAALAGSQRRRLHAAGLVCQRSSLVAWDADSGKALSPVLSWQDTRAAAWLAAQAWDVEKVHRYSGLYPNAHFGLSKIRWLLDNSVAVQRAAAQGRLRIGPLAAFLAYRLLHEQPLRVDPANASRTLLMDIDRGNWCEEMLQRFDIERSWLPDIVASDADYGSLRVSNRRLPLRLLTGDQSAAAFAFGMPQADRGYANLGTGAFIYRLAPAASPPSRLLRSVIHWSDQPRFVLEGTVNGAGSALSWWGSEQGLGDAGVDLDAHWPIDAVSPMLFLNGIGGLGSPDWRADFPSHFVGQGGVHEQRVAVAESIVFLLQRNLDCLQSSAGVLTGLTVSGGLSHSNRLCQSLADLSGLPVQRPQDCEASARGAAFLLAGQPTQWASLPVRTFEAMENPALQARYRHWTTLLEAVLATG